MPNPAPPRHRSAPPRPWLAGRASLALVAACIALVAPLIAATPARAQDEPVPLLRPEEGQSWRMYRAAFGRYPDRAGQAWWSRALVARHLDVRTLAAAFAASEEFRARYGAAPSDGQLVVALYRNVLDRAPDPAGRAYWLAQLAAGLARPDLLALFAESPENVARTGTGLAPLPPFAVEVLPVTAAELGPSWRPGCPVDPALLVRLRAVHLGYDGRARVGELVVHRDAAGPVAEVLGRLYEARFPIRSMIPVSAFGGSDDASMAADNSSAFNCRPLTGGSRWSEHAYGLAVDLNPLVNPYRRGDTVLPPAGAAWVDRTRYHPGMVYAGDVVTRAFAAVGWTWGGTWTSSSDWQHVSSTGR